MDAEVILDRRRLRRKTTFWRIMAFFLGIAAILGLYVAVSGDGALAPRKDHIARIEVDGFIPTRPDAARLILDAAKSPSVKAIVLRINSPGGAASGGEALYRSVLEAGKDKPIVAVIDGLGTSAAYMTAIAADYIVARESAITGSIGVIFQFGHIDQLLDKIGAEFVEVKSAPLKGQPTPFAPPSDKALEMLQGVVDDTYQWFVDLVVDRRGLSRSEVLRLADGSIYTGRQALSAKLIDQVGSENEALAWLVKERGIPASMPVDDWRRRGSVFSGLPTSSFAGLARLIGLDPELFPALESVVPERLKVDGLLSVWQASHIVGQVARGRQ